MEESGEQGENPLALQHPCVCSVENLAVSESSIQMRRFSVILLQCYPRLGREGAKYFRHSMQLLCDDEKVAWYGPAFRQTSVKERIFFLHCWHCLQENCFATTIRSENRRIAPTTKTTNDCPEYSRNMFRWNILPCTKRSAEEHSVHLELWSARQKMKNERNSARQAVMKINALSFISNCGRGGLIEGSEKFSRILYTSAGENKVRKWDRFVFTPIFWFRWASYRASLIKQSHLITKLPSQFEYSNEWWNISPSENSCARLGIGRKCFVSSKRISPHDKKNFSFSRTEDDKSYKKGEVDGLCKQIFNCVFLKRKLIASCGRLQALSSSFIRWIEKRSFNNNLNYTQCPGYKHSANKRLGYNWEYLSGRNECCQKGR